MFPAKGAHFCALSCQWPTSSQAKHYLLNMTTKHVWAGTLGRPASYGCIILGIPEAETLYNWTDIGVIVVVE